jgi:lipopolysaccharide heptosyltransferase II
MIKPKNLLLIRSDRIGDVILSLPLAEIIKKHYPDCRITFLLRDYTKDLAESNPFIDEVLVLKEKDGEIVIKENLKMLGEKNFDTCITVYPTFKIAWLVFRSGIKYRIGSGYRWYSLLFNKRVFEHRKYADKHELEYNVNLLNEIGIDEKISKDNVHFFIEIDKSVDEKVSKTLIDNGISTARPIVIVHPGSGGSAVDLPAEKFKLLIERLVESNVQVLITGSENEIELCQKLVVNESVKNFAGKFSLKELVALINKADVFVSNSTGPIHLAAALDKYSIGFYPHLTACLPKRWGPYSNKSKIYMPESDCEDCKNRQCKKTECMETINIDKVSSDILEIIKSFNKE